MVTPDGSLSTLVRRLHRAELDHLREHCAELAARIDELEAALRDAEDRAEHWHDQAVQLMNDISSHGHVIGLTRDGQLHMLAPQESAA